MVVVSDNGGNITKAVKDSFGTYISHTINLVVEKSIATTESISALLTKTRNLIKYFKRNTTICDEL